MIEEFLRNEGVKFEEIRHERAYTAQETAATEHVSGYVFAKTVVVTDGENHYLLVLPATYHVDLKKAGKVVGAKVKLAPEEEMGSLFAGCEVGAEPPFGSIFGMKTFVDTSFEGREDIVFRAGSHEKTIKMSYQDYAELEKPVAGSFAAAA